MAGRAEVKHGDPQRPEIKLFKETPVEEIAKRSGGWVEYHDGGRPSMISYLDLNAQILLDREDGPFLEIGGNIKLRLNNSAVILGEDRVTFVRPVERSLGVLGEFVLSWVTISQNDGITIYTKHHRAVTDWFILRAAAVCNPRLIDEKTRRGISA